MLIRSNKNDQFIAIDLDLTQQQDLVALKQLRNRNIIIGNLDGIHLGHKEVIRHAKSDNSAGSYGPVALVFDPHTKSYFDKLNSFVELSPKSIKSKLAKKFGCSGIIFIKFNKYVQEITATEFLNEVIIKHLTAHTLYASQDFRFGYKRLGNIELLKHFESQGKIKLKILEPVQIDGSKVSSSRIREHLVNTKIETANKLLGHPWYTEGKVIKGAQRGREMGYPTINLHFDNNLPIPFGIYSNLVNIEGKLYKGTGCYGVRPNFPYHNGTILEVNLSGYNKSAYDKIAKVAFFHYIRPEMKFCNTKELTSQISKDVKTAMSKLDADTYNYYLSNLHKIFD